MTTTDPRVDAYIDALPAGHGNATARTVSFRGGEPVNGPALVAMFRAIIANNRAGGWRKIKAGLV